MRGSGDNGEMGERKLSAEASLPWLQSLDPRPITLFNYYILNKSSFCSNEKWSGAARGTLSSLIEPIPSDRGEDLDWKIIYEHLNWSREKCRKLISQANYFLFLTTGYLTLYITELSHLFSFHVLQQHTSAADVLLNKEAILKRPQWQESLRSDPVSSANSRFLPIASPHSSCASVTFIYNVYDFVGKSLPSWLITVVDTQQCSDLVKTEYFTPTRPHNVAKTKEWLN